MCKNSSGTMLNYQDFSFYTLTNGPDDDNYWRVDWFGYMSYVNTFPRGNGSRRSEPLVDVYLSKLASAPRDTNFLMKFASDYSDQKTVKIPIEVLTLLRIGDVWRRGRLVYQPKYQEEKIHVNPGVCESVSAGGKHDSGEYYIPASVHPNHLKATKVFCEKVAIDSTSIAIVPHYTILLAYFSRCSYVFRKLFEFGAYESSWHNEEKSSWASGAPALLMLKTKVHDVAAEQVARLVWDEYGRKAVQMVSTQLAMNQSNNDHVRPKTCFPFTGDATLKVRGRWCRKKGEKRQTFIVFDILKCSSKYPFESLIYFRDNPGDHNRDGQFIEGENTAGKAGIRVKKPLLNKSPDLNVDDEPSSEFDQLQFLNRSGSVFTDLDNKLIKKERYKDYLEKAGSQGSSCEGVTSDVGVGDGEAYGSTAPVGFNAGGKDRRPRDDAVFDWPICRLSLLKDMCESVALEENKNQWEYILVNSELGDPEGLHSFFPKTYTKGSREAKWHYVNYIQGVEVIGPYKFRRCLVCKVSLKEGYLYLLEPERRIKVVRLGWIEIDSLALLKIKSKYPLSYEFLEGVLLASAKKRGTWVAAPTSTVEVKSIRHPSSETIIDGSYSSAMWTAIQNEDG